MNIMLWLLLCAVAFGLGALFHVWVAREMAASKADLSTWASRLRLAIASDEKTAKAAVEKIAVELEAKV